MNKTNINDSLKKLGEIVDWFEKQKEVDVEIGLEKVKDGARLIKIARERLRQIENEFEEVKKEIEEDEEDKAHA
jgi:exonuclease VII small subunit